MNLAPERRWDDYWAGKKSTSSDLASHQRMASVASQMLGDTETAHAVLDLGAGDGHLTGHIAECMPTPHPAIMVASDLSASALSEHWRGPEGVYRVVCDASRLPFKSESMTVVLSFGYASVASYFDPSIQAEINRVLAPDGRLISDFRNSFSLWMVLVKPHWFAKSVTRYLGFGKRHYHVGAIGLRRYFSHARLQLVSRRYLLGFLPLNLFSWQALVRFDQLLDRFHLNRLLGRIFIARFDKQADLGDSGKG